MDVQSEHPVYLPQQQQQQRHKINGRHSYYLSAQEDTVNLRQTSYGKILPINCASLVGAALSSQMKRWHL